MATATAGANVALRFDIVADNGQFKSAVAEAQSSWRSATADMQTRSGGIGDAFISATDKIGSVIGGFAENLYSALNGGSAGVERATLAGFESIKKGAEGLIDYAASFGEKWGGKFGERAAGAIASILKDNVGGAFDYGLGKAAPLVDSEAFKSLASTAQQAAASFDALTGSAGEVENKVKSAADGFKNAIDVARGMRVAAGDFEAILEPLDKQIEKHQRAAQLVGKTADEVVRLRAEWAMLDSEVDPEKMAEDQTAKYKAKIDEAAAAAAEEESARQGERQRRAYMDITAQLDRQVESVRLKRGEHGLTVGVLAQEQAILDANFRMQRQGRALSEEETRAVRDRAVALGAYTDMLARETQQRTTLQGLQRQASQIDIEAQTLTMAAGAAASYKAEMAALQSFKEKNIAVSDEFRARIHAEAEAIGRATAEAQRQRDALRMVGEVGQTVGRGLESAFSNWIEGQDVKFRDVVDSMLRDLARLAFRMAAIQPLFGGNGTTGLFTQGFSRLGDALGFNGVGGGFSGWSAGTSTLPGFAGGGEAAAGQPMWVGENGRPELFVPKQAGRIIPGEKLGGMGGYGGDIRIAPPQTTVNITAPPGSQATETGRSTDSQGNVTLELFIEQVQGMVARGIAEGSGPVGSAIQSRFGLSAAAGAR